MNAHALLTAQGWRGTGHSLHPTNDSTGLKHHLLIKRNDDGRGLGSKKDHKQEAWWLNAFDQALKGIDTKSGTMKQTLHGGALEKITAKGAAGKYTGSRGLYSSFVRGGLMEGTVGVSLVAGLPTPPESGAGTPAAGNSTDEEGKEETKKETKEERMARREAKRLRKAEKRAKKEEEEQAARKVEKKKAKKAERQRAKDGETKEERRARREARRKRKEEKRRLKAASGG
ncbi:hypothetical protein F5B19DRAFT_465541 [Rostrohypoxylon terebratum]|nr:hypothetical protein F5B19DRAFT_465541 [Rostrohypoxylon terebratum]